MKRLTSILAISVIAVMSAGAARADIASTTYVDNKVSPVSTKANTNAGEIATLKSGKQDKLGYTAENAANKVASGGDMEKALAATDADTKYPTLKATMEIAQIAAGAETGKLKELANHDTVSTDLIDNGAVTSAKIADGTIVNADIADNAAIAQSKIAGLAGSIADAKKAGTDAASALNTYKTSNDAAVKAVKTTADNTAAAVNNATTGLAATKKIADDNAAKLKTMATSETVTALTTRVGTAETNITSLQNGKQDKLVSSGANANISGSNGVTVTVGTDGKVAVSGNQNAIDTAIAEAKSAGTAAASALNAYKTSNDAAVAKKADSATMTTELAKKENTSNKVTSISSTSTDTQYPSAKAVYTELAKKQNNITIDSELSSTSTNPVQNKVVNNALAGKQATLTTAQLNAANSGITAAKVTTYNGYDAKITNAQNTANTAKTTAEAAIAAPAAATTSSDGVYTLTMKVVNGTKTYAWEQIGR